MKFIAILSAILVVTLASDHNQQHQAGWFRQNIRTKTQISSSSSSSESDEQFPKILKTKIYNSDRCILVPEPTSDEINEYHQWAEQQDKQYSSEAEESCRMINVIYKLRDIHAHNKRFDEGKETFKRALNHLSDLTRKEFKTKLLLKETRDKILPQSNVQNLPEFPDPRPSVDYRNENLVSPVGQQGRCGCCWAWSAAAVIEGQLRKCGITSESVSTQNMLDCVAKTYDGCAGGNPYEAFSYEKTGGIVTAAKYPYAAKQNQCVYNKNDIIAYVDQSFRHIFKKSPHVEPYMRKIVSSVGPISAVIYANKNFQDYASGVYSSTDCNNSLPNHAVTIVGYGTDPNFGDYWLLKNSWSNKWGENGFGRVARGKNMCLIESRVYYAQITDQNRNVCKLS
ncbi:unnamed protein product [Chironomus riparius]|uniref:Uncharacterized protein n=1 Tax=Chironomus riparius TaxID=315576 RepID=A0A9N9S7J2_9DIPT|nr:unnamed protein product [Chironomus riparius]